MHIATVKVLCVFFFKYLIFQLVWKTQNLTSSEMRLHLTNRTFKVF